MLVLKLPRFFSCRVGEGTGAAISKETCFSQKRVRSYIVLALDWAVQCTWRKEFRAFVIFKRKNVATRLHLKTSMVCAHKSRFVAFEWLINNLSICRHFMLWNLLHKENSNWEAINVFCPSVTFNSSMAVKCHCASMMHVSEISRWWPANVFESHCWLISTEHTYS